MRSSLLLRRGFESTPEAGIPEELYKEGRCCLGGLSQRQETHSRGRCNPGRKGSWSRRQQGGRVLGHSYYLEVRDTPRVAVAQVAIAREPDHAGCVRSQETS